MKSLQYLMFTLFLTILIGCENKQENTKDSDSKDTLLLSHEDSLKLANEEREKTYEEWRKYNNSVKAHKEQDTIVGNFTKGKTDTLFIIQCSYDSEEREKDNYHCIMYSSNKLIPKLDLYYNIAPKLVNEGDLDGNGTTEVGILDTWYSSACRMYRIYTLHNNRWYYLIPPLYTAANLRASGLELAEPTNEKNKIRIRYCEENAPLSSCSSGPIVDTIVSVSLKSTNYDKHYFGE